VFAIKMFILSVTYRLRICAVSNDSCYRAMTCFYPVSPINRTAVLFGRSMMLAVFSFAASWLYNGLELVHDAALDDLYSFNSLTLFPSFAWICFSKIPTMIPRVSFPPLQEPASTC
jgi:hypothetical protein